MDALTFRRLTWIVTLEEGLYRKGIGHLFKADGSFHEEGGPGAFAETVCDAIYPDTEQYCCIGVWCEVKYVTFRKKMQTDLPLIEYLDEDGDEWYRNFREDLGISVELQHFLAAMNDGDDDHMESEFMTFGHFTREGGHGYSHREIARFLRQLWNLEGVWEWR